jgi:hypothetical protein
LIKDEHLLSPPLIKGGLRGIFRILSLFSKGSTPKGGRDLYFPVKKILLSPPFSKEEGKRNLPFSKGGRKAEENLS